MASHVDYASNENKNTSNKGAFISNYQSQHHQSTSLPPQKQHQTSLNKVNISFMGESSLTNLNAIVGGSNSPHNDFGGGYKTGHSNLV